MRQLDNAVLTVATAASGLRTVTIEASTGELFSVELSNDKALALGTDLLKEPPAAEIPDTPAEPQQPAPEAPTPPETPAQE